MGLLRLVTVLTESMVLSETNSGLSLMWSWGPHALGQMVLLQHRGYRIPSKSHPCSLPGSLSISFLPGNDRRVGVPIKTPRGRSGLIKWCALFPLWEFGEVTGEVSGTRSPWKEVPRQLGVLLSGPRFPDYFCTIEALEVSPSPKCGPQLRPGNCPIDSC